MEGNQNNEKKWWHHQGPNFNAGDEEALKHWRAWGSWFSWGSPVGLGLFFIEIGLFLYFLHIAGIIA